MRPFLYNFFHSETNDRSEHGMVNIPKSEDQWPLSWKTTSYKNYYLLRSLPLHDDGGQTLNILSNRGLDGRGLGKNKITPEIISYILKCGYGLQNHALQTKEIRKENRTVPSAGKRYPLEVYLFFFEQTGEYQSGVYHYGIQNHTLEPVLLSSFSQMDIESFSLQQATKNAEGMIVISSIFSRTTEKYGSRGYRYILLEAGHVAQNIILAATEKKINIIPIGGGNESIIENFIGLNSQYEGVVYTLFF